MKLIWIIKGKIHTRVFSRKGFPKENIVSCLCSLLYYTLLLLVIYMLCGYCSWLYDILLNKIKRYRYCLEAPNLNRGNPIREKTLVKIFLYSQIAEFKPLRKDATIHYKITKTCLLILADLSLNELALSLWRLFTWTPWCLGLDLTLNGLDLKFSSQIQLIPGDPFQVLVSTLVYPYSLSVLEILGRLEEVYLDLLNAWRNLAGILVDLTSISSCWTSIFADLGENFWCL